MTFIKAWSGRSQQSINRWQFYQKCLLSRSEASLYYMLLLQGVTRFMLFSPLLLHEYLTLIVPLSRSKALNIIVAAHLGKGRA